MNESTPLAATSVSAEAVAAYLREHEDFFAEQEELLATLRLPHQRGDTVSLVERQMALLRERNTEMRQRLAQLMEIARDNDRLFDKTRRLILGLMDAASQEEVVIAVEDSLRQEFQVPFVSLILFNDAPLPVGRAVSLAQAHSAIGALLSEGKGTAGTLREHELDFLFGEEQRQQIGSTALVFLESGQGVLAIASRDPLHYKSSVGTLFLSYIGEVLSRVLPRFNGALRSVR